MRTVDRYIFTYFHDLLSIVLSQQNEENENRKNELTEQQGTVLGVDKDRAKSKYPTKNI